jgi:hypothetical protein
MVMGFYFISRAVNLLPLSAFMEFNVINSPKWNNANL